MNCHRALAQPFNSLKTAHMIKMDMGNDNQLDLIGLNFSFSQIVGKFFLAAPVTRVYENAVLPSFYQIGIGKPEPNFVNTRHQSTRQLLSEFLTSRRLPVQDIFIPAIGRLSQAPNNLVDASLHLAFQVPNRGSTPAWKESVPVPFLFLQGLCIWLPSCSQVPRGPSPGYDCLCI